MLGDPAAGIATVTSRIGLPSGSESRSVRVSPGVKPLASVGASPVSKLAGPPERIRSLSPKKCENPLPALADVPSEIATPLAPAAAIDSPPPAKLAEPKAPSAVLSEVRKLAGVKALDAPPSTLSVPALKLMSTRRCNTPAALTTATVVWPVKPVTAVGRSRPVLRPFSALGAGEELEALCAALSCSLARETNSPSWSAMPGSLMSRRSSRPRIWPLPMVRACGLPGAPGVSALT